MVRVKGPLPRFADFHVQMAIGLIARHDQISRNQVADKLEIGEGSVRTILNRLKEQGLITSSRGGHSLTKKGRHLVSNPSEFVQVDAGDLTVGKVNVATIVRNAASRIKLGIEQRDEAIKAGAKGATVLVFEVGRLRFRDAFVEVGVKASQALISPLKPREGDVIIIGTADDLGRAESGAIAAARTLRKRAR